MLISLLFVPTSPSDPITLFTKSSYSGSLPGRTTVSGIKPRTFPLSSLKLRILLEALLRTTVVLPSTSEKKLHCVVPTTDLRVCASLNRAKPSPVVMSMVAPLNEILVAEPTAPVIACVVSLALVLL